MAEKQKVHAKVKRTVSISDEKSYEPQKEKLLPVTNSRCSSPEGSVSVCSSYVTNKLRILQAQIEQNRMGKFNCHEKALREAGYNLTSLTTVNMRKKVPSTKKRLSIKLELQSRDQIMNKLIHKGRVPLEEFLPKAKKEASHLKVTGCMYSNIINSRGIKVDTSKVLSYLYLVKEYPDEYVQQQKLLDHSSGKPLREIKGVGQLYKDRHRDCEKTDLETLVQNAAYELGHRRLHPVCQKYEDLEREKERALQRGLALINNKKAGKGRQLDMKGLVVEDTMTPLERARAEAELYVKELTMSQIIKAREQALTILGDNSKSITMWWKANQHCRYLRWKHHNCVNTAL